MSSKESTSAERNITAQINERAREIWLAGLGALARTQRESQKVFDYLVKEGETFEERTRKDVDARVTELRGSVGTQVTRIRTMANDNVSRIEHLFEDRVARVLARLGVPSAEDIKQLSKQVQELSREVKALNESTTRKAA